jgi:hypothetical protein
MTEQEWWACTDPVVLVRYALSRVSSRKLRLFACAFARRWYGTDCRELAAAITTAERWADGDRTADLTLHATFYVCFKAAWQAAEEGTALAVAAWAESSHKRLAEEAEIDFLRCVTGNPFRPVQVNPRWLTAAVASLARTIYEERSHACLPILADALEEAGCDNKDMLTHLRSDGPHCRGCWPVPTARPAASSRRSCGSRAGRTLAAG